MVVFVDLEGDEEDFSDLGNRPTLNYNPIAHLQTLRLQDSSCAVSRDDFSPPTRIDHDECRPPRTQSETSSFSRALSAYPIALSLAHHLDLNDLHSLSLTCSSIHTSLTQFASNLTSHSLPCTYAAQPLVSEMIAQYNAAIIASHEASYNGAPALPFQRSSHAMPNLLNAFSVPLYPQNRVAGGSRQMQSTGAEENKTMFRTSKINPCARDLVAECRKCGTIVCRNCAAKPPSDSCLKDRFRRLCKVCLGAPLVEHLRPPGHEAEDGGSGTSSTSSSRDHIPSTTLSRAISSTEAFTAPAFQRTVCTCASRGVYLCQPCGQNLRAQDTTYKRVWTWRSRYSTHIGGGLGTGLGEGDQGQKCARGGDCLDTCSEGICWVEIDCSEDDGGDVDGNGGTGSGRPATPAEHELHESKPGYYMHEIEGIGGVVKKKVKKRVKVGATVWEYDEERESGRYLEREASGRERSWCGWCERVCPGKEDRDAVGRR